MVLRFLGVAVGGSLGSSSPGFLGTHWPGTPDLGGPFRPAIIVIDSATYLLTISSPDINKVAMSLYDIYKKCSRIV